MFGTFSPYSIDAICMGSLLCSDRTPPRVMPTKNIAASNTAITAFISWRRQSSHLLVQEFLVASVHLTSPFVFIGNAAKLPLFH